MKPCIAAAAHREPLDSLAQFCGLSLPTFKQRDWSMSSCAYIAYRIGQHHAVVAARASSPAGIASTERTARRQKRVDFATGYCGLSPPTLFERIGIMAADGQPLPTRFHAAHHGCVTRQRRARRPELAQRTGSSSSGPEVRAGLPVKTTPTSIASGPADGQATAIRMRIGKRFTGPIHPAKTTPTAIASGPTQTPSQARLDNRKWMAVDKPSSRPFAIHHLTRQDMNARAGPFA
jgi:hypothetical protein